MDRRAEELATLKTIYPELVIYGEDSVRIELPITLQAPLHIVAQSQPLNHRILSHLPPISITFTLPVGYPCDAPPAVKLASTASWLPNATAEELETVATTFWEKYGRCEVLFAYITHVLEAAETNFALDQLVVSSDCFPQLVDYDRQTARDVFNKGSHDCTICLTPKPGHKCHCMERCSHIFCVECLQDYYNTAIETGDVNKVQCLSPNCGTENDGIRARRVKRARHISPRELLRIPLERAIVQRYVDIKRKKRLESDTTTIWCPRKWCQGAAKGSRYPRSTVPLEEMDESDAEGETTIPLPIPPAATAPDANETPEEQKIRLKYGDRLSVCDDCGFAFCNVCHTTWHGELLWCYPERNVAQVTAEEQASLDYIATHTSPCPMCKAPVSKTEGCNHMTCGMCEYHFCYLCSTGLDRENPYKHFGTESTPCYDRLWVLVEGGEEDEGIFTHGVRGEEIMTRRRAEEERRQEHWRLVEERRVAFEQQMGARLHL